jgi:hypothetical protein
MERDRLFRAYCIQKIAIFLVLFGFLAAAKAQIGLLPPPTISVQPVGTNVQYQGTATFTVSAYTTLGVINSVTWLLNGKRIQTSSNIVVTLQGGLLSSSIGSTLTVTHVVSADVGNISVQITSLLAGTATSQNAPLNIVQTTTVNSVSSGTGMVSSGFQLQFSGPTGSNLVIQASSDLVHWVPISTNVITGSVVSYIDAAAKAQPKRFYRAKLQ